MIDQLLEQPVALLGLLLGAVVGLVTADRLMRRRDFPFVALLLTVGVLPLLQNAVLALQNAETLTGAAIAVGRLQTAAFWVAVPFVVAHLARDADPDRLFPGGRLDPLVPGILAFTGTALVATGVHESLSLEAPSALIAAILIWASARTAPLETVVGGLKVATGALLLTSLVAGLAGLPGVWAGPDGTFLPGIERFAGLTGHPNRLAPYAVLYLILERSLPSRGLWRLLGSGVALTALLAAQSKTGLVALALVAVTYWLSGPGRRRTTRVLGAGILASLFLLTLLAFDSVEQTAAEVDHPFVGATQLTGRPEVWEAGYRAFLEAPVWGAGPDFFSLYAERTGQDWAGQAHNQFVHSFTTGGVVAGIGLCLYYLTMVVMAYRARHVSGGGSWAILALIVARSLTQTPLRLMTLEHLALIALLTAWYAARYASSASIRTGALHEGGAYEPIAPGR